MPKEESPNNVDKSCSESCSECCQKCWNTSLCFIIVPALLLFFSFLFALKHFFVTYQTAFKTFSETYYLEHPQNILMKNGLYFWLSPAFALIFLIKCYEDYLGYCAWLITRVLSLILAVALLYFAIVLFGFWYTVISLIIVVLMAIIILRFVKRLTDDEKEGYKNCCLLYLIGCLICLLLVVMVIIFATIIF